MGQLTIPEMVILTGVLVRQEQPLPIPMDIRFWIPMETPLFFRIMSILEGGSDNGWSGWLL